MTPILCFLKYLEICLRLHFCSSTYSQASDYFQNRAEKSQGRNRIHNPVSGSFFIFPQELFLFFYLKVVGITVSVLSVGLGILVPFSTLLLQSLTFLGSICLSVVLILAGVWGFSPKEGLNEGNCVCLASSC